MGAYAMGAPWLRFDCGDTSELERRLRDVWAEMTGKTQTRTRRGPGPGWGGPGGGFGPGFGGPGHGGPPWARGMRGPKARRGDVRAAILSVLSDAPRNGYQVIQEIAELSNGEWRPSPGSVYPTIQQLQDEGLVESDDERGRRTIRLTDSGVAWAEENGTDLAAVWAPFARTEEVPSEQPSGHADIKSEIGQVVSAVWQLATQGSEQQKKAALDVLVDTRRRLYGILADGRDGER